MKLISRTRGDHLESLGSRRLGSQAGEGGAPPLGDLCVAMVTGFVYPSISTLGSGGNDPYFAGLL